MLIGEAGIDKTRLAQESAMRAAERGFRVLVGRCSEQYASLPFFPIVEALNGNSSPAAHAFPRTLLRRSPALAQLLAGDA